MTHWQAFYVLGFGAATVSGALLLSISGCSLVDPQAGAPQAACGISSASSSAAGPAYYGPGSSHASAAPICAASSGSACDVCENAHCCASRSACYGDPVCACADLGLDECLDAEPSGADSASQVARCWSAFSAHGTIEQERVACERAWCKSECAVP